MVDTIPKYLFRNQFTHKQLLVSPTSLRPLTKPVFKFNLLPFSFEPRNPYIHTSIRILLKSLRLFHSAGIRITLSARIRAQFKSVLP